MIVSVKAVCPTDGQVTLPPSAITLVLYPVEAWSYYAFTCPKCGQSIRKKAGAAEITLLTEACVTPVEVRAPAEMFEPKCGEPLTTNDVLDFVLELLATDDVAAAAATTSDRKDRHGQ